MKIVLSAAFAAVVLASPAWAQPAAAPALQDYATVLLNFVKAFASKYASAEDAKYLAQGKYAVKYYPYDWTLNEAAK